MTTRPVSYGIVVLYLGSVSCCPDEIPSGRFITRFSSRFLLFCAHNITAFYNERTRGATIEKLSAPRVPPRHYIRRPYRTTSRFLIFVQRASGSGRTFIYHGPFGLHLARPPASVSGVGHVTPDTQKDDFSFRPRFREQIGRLIPLAFRFDSVAPRVPERQYTSVSANSSVRRV